ncbi:uncharacterized protein LOC106878281, partial [Octopus bimaculoides]|uniref:uncharacterized protein LOC106878281 n=1 Tax=Octopus bimaculoides TaxID=37653 RepID=UPI00071D230C
CLIASKFSGHISFKLHWNTGIPIIVKMFRLKRYLCLLFFSIFACTLVFIGIKMTQKNELKSRIFKSEQKKYPQNLQDVISQSVAIAKDIMKKHNLVLFTLINNAYLPLVYSWLCNTVNMGIHEQILFITTDAISKQKFEKDWPDVKVVVLPEASLNGNQAYSKVGYVKLMVKRTEILNSLLQNNIEILLFEVDCLWVSNPIDECKKIALENLQDRKKKHVVIINNNWIVGNANKIKRAKKFGHWFIDDSMKCNMNQVDRVVNRGLYV